MIFLENTLIHFRLSIFVTFWWNNISKQLLSIIYLFRLLLCRDLHILCLEIIIVILWFKCTCFLSICIYLIGNFVNRELVFGIKLSLPTRFKIFFSDPILGFNPIPSFQTHARIIHAHQMQNNGYFALGMRGIFLGAQIAPQRAVFKAHLCTSHAWDLAEKGHFSCFTHVNPNLQIWIAICTIT